MNRRNFITAILLTPLGAWTSKLKTKASRILPPIQKVRVRWSTGWQTYNVVYDRHPSGRPWTKADLELIGADTTSSQEDQA